MKKILLIILALFRINNNDQGKLWEFMRQNDPDDAIFMKMPPFSDEQFIFGKNCL